MLCSRYIIIMSIFYITLFLVAELSYHLSPGASNSSCLVGWISGAGLVYGADEWYRAGSVSQTGLTDSTAHAKSSTCSACSKTIRKRPSIPSGWFLLKKQTMGLDFFPQCCWDSSTTALALGAWQPSWRAVAPELQQHHGLFSWQQSSAWAWDAALEPQ